MPWLKFKMKSEDWTNIVRTEKKRAQKKEKK